MFSIEAHLVDVVLHVGVIFVHRILRATGFSKVRKSSAERKVMKVLSQGELKYNIAGRILKPGGKHTLWQTL